MRIDHRIARLPQPAHQKVALFLVIPGVDADPLQPPHQMLHQRRGVHEPQRAVAETQPAAQLFLVGAGRIDGDVADALAGQRQVFGVGSYDDAVGVMRRHLRKLPAVEDYPAVGFIAEQEDFAAVFGLLAVEQRRQRRQIAAGIDRPGGVVGRVDDDGAGVGVHRLLDGRQIQLKLLIGGDGDRRPPVIVDVIQIFPEVGRQDDDLVAGVEDGFEDDIGGGGGPAGHNDFGAGERQAGIGGQGSGHRLAGFGIAGVGHIAVHPRLGVFGQAAQFGVEFRRRLHHRIAQRQIEHVFRADARLKLQPLLEDPANPPPLLHKLPHLPRNRHNQLSSFAGAIRWPAIAHIAATLPPGSLATPPMPCQKRPRTRRRAMPAAFQRPVLQQLQYNRNKPSTSQTEPLSKPRRPSNFQTTHSRFAASSSTISHPIAAPNSQASRCRKAAPSTGRPNSAAAEVTGRSLRPQGMMWR